MKNSPYEIDPAFARLPRIKISGSPWVLRALSLLVSCSRLFHRWNDGLSATSHVIQGREGNRLKVIEIAPESITGSAPAIVYFHGGGFFMSYGAGHLKQVEAYAEKLQVRIFFVCYRVSTKVAFPGPLNDCVSALDWVYDNAATLGVNSERIAVMGDSAGGCLAASVAQQSYDESRAAGLPQKIRTQLLIYPVIDSDCKTVSATQFHDTPLWNAHNNLVMWKVYLHDSPYPAPPPPYASPMHRNDFQGLAPAYIECVEFDPLRDEALAYGEALSNAGVEVRQFMIDAAVHGYDHVDCEISTQGKTQRLAHMKSMLCD
ncbi:MAG: alpha/beta hydrolase [Halieaceae bacterium]|jgi:acetyl esterase|nr:alpha/beta hydrolase [Halieaceae bacterium]